MKCNNYSNNAKINKVELKLNFFYLKDEFQNRLCQCNTLYGCSSMGFKASKSAEEGNFYLYTNADRPYCIYN